MRGSADEALIAEGIPKPLAQPGFPRNASPLAVFAALRDRLVHTGTVDEARTLQQAIDGILRAGVAVLADGVPAALVAVIPDCCRRWRGTWIHTRGV